MHCGRLRPPSDRCLSKGLSLYPHRTCASHPRPIRHHERYAYLAPSWLAWQCRPYRLSVSTISLRCL
ncbi:hypothetical protein CLIM01_06787 [Colletotrichum limetticola]|uniref:Uncharacterized protein n=1 Tax=Colletotrichum limetticola TaxID=1209924 RepID=A0ABQ9PWB5_9PEZI|nr:hypothetical protein CLIM01_06787 [Colletotrichum limetticola]